MSGNSKATHNTAAMMGGSVYAVAANLYMDGDAMVLYSTSPYGGGINFISLSITLTYLGKAQVGLAPTIRVYTCVHLPAPCIVSPHPPCRLTAHLHQVFLSGRATVSHNVAEYGGGILMGNSHPEYRIPDLLYISEGASVVNNSATNGGGIMVSWAVETPYLCAVNNSMCWCFYP